MFWFLWDQTRIRWPTGKYTALGTALGQSFFKGCHKPTEALTPTGGTAAILPTHNRECAGATVDGRRVLLLWHRLLRKAHTHTHMLHARLRSIQNKGRRKIHPPLTIHHRGRHCSGMVLLGLTCDIYRGHLKDQIWVRIFRFCILRPPLLVQCLSKCWIKFKIVIFHANLKLGK